MREDKTKKSHPKPEQVVEPVGDDTIGQPAGQAPSPTGGPDINAGTVNSAGPEQVQAENAEAQPPMIALSMEEFDNLQKDLKKSQSEAAGYFEGWQRERADFINYKKRVDRDNAQVQQNALIGIVKKYLVILDDLDRALKTRPSEGEMSAWGNGIELIYRKLLNLLENEGVRRMSMEDTVFDPTRHEAITYEESPAHQSGQIIEVIQPGYLLGDRVIRPAQVRVAK